MPLEWGFVCTVSQRSYFIFFPHGKSQLSHRHLFKTPSFLTVNCNATCDIYQVSMYSWSAYSVPFVYLSNSVSISHSHNYFNFRVSLHICHLFCLNICHFPPSLVHLFQEHLSYSQPFALPYTFWNQLCKFCEEPYGNCIRNCIKSITQFGEI